MNEEIFCYECSEEIGDYVFECGLCRDIFCKSCAETHKCVELVDEENVECFNCGKVEREMFFCEECNNLFCINCSEEHEEEETQENISQQSKEDYIKEQVIEGIKK